jgi:CrcB protein
MQSALIAGLGGFIGTIFRYLLNSVIYFCMPSASFPYGTLAVNVMGCLISGFLNGLAESRGIAASEIRVFVFVGILGGFTTFSSFGYDTFTLAREGHIALAGINVFLQLGLGLGAVFSGYFLSRLL